MSSRTWPQIGGRTTGEDLVRALDESRAGVLITGASGSGKSYLTSLLTKEIRDDAYIVVLRASAGLTASPYGALNVLLRDLDSQFLSHPALVLSALTALLTARAEGKPVYLVIENAGDVDEFAGAVISQLARNGTAGLILTCTDPQRLGSELSRLCTDGYLARIELEPLPLPEAISWLEASLGGRISASAAHEFWTASGGNPHYLKMLAGELVESGALAVRDGVWVLTAMDRPHGPAITDLVVTRLGKLGPGERMAMEIVSLAGTVPLEALLAVALPDDVDALEKRGILVVDDSLPRMVGMQNQLLGDVIRANIPTGRSSDLRRRFCEAVEPALMHPALRVALAAWALECGSPLTDTEALHAAAIANTRADYPLALRLVRSVPGHSHSAAAVAEESTALAALGAVSEARSVLRQYREQAGGSADANDAGPPSSADTLRFQLAEAAVLQADRGTMDQAAEHLRHVRKALDGDLMPGDVAPTGLPHGLHDGPDAERVLREELVLAEARVAGHLGRYAEAAVLLEDALQDFETHGPEFRFKAGSLMCEAWALTGRQAEAADMAGQLLAHGRDPMVSAAAAWSAAGRLRFALLLAGCWEDSASMLQPRWDSPLPAGQPFPASFDLALAVLRCLQGRAHEGLESLVPLIGQLRVRDDEGLLGVATAAAAYASALQGESDQAGSYLAQKGTGPTRPGRPMEWIAAYFTILAVDGVDRPQAASDALMRLADDDHAAGNHGLEVLALSTAVRLGRTAVAPRLLDTALRCDGDFAGLCAAYANAVLAHDVAQQVAVAQLAQDLQHDRFAFDVAEAVIRGAHALEDRALLLQARRIAETCRHRMRAPEDTSQQEDRITARELEIATLAARGHSNKAIAARLHLSVRTVEGHLYQIYGKLKIVERSELPFALGLADGNQQ
ncbi:helix-turn-helix transcriptional regulator [Pseudarthrobacter chlorophenolicus]|uniref:helix-turn-helix transcriptional regulator n=1 Tax=Pseudarthrobacter chlorophenolicus TaxID=85085 RepID=UPI0005F28E02|nr:LuxR C-terminal-related transcriptional regulator [Pseudarthrobacter chlorophenolicus]